MDDNSRKITKTQNCRQVLNWLSNIAVFLFVLSGVVLPLFCPWAKEVRDNNDYHNTAGIICQVITALVCCVASIIGISFSIQDSSFFGVPIKELRELRDDRVYSIKGIMIISVCMVAFNAVFYATNLIFASYVLSIFAVVFCIITICREIPLMAKNEEAGLAILKSRLFAENKEDEVQARIFDEAIKYLIWKMNLKTTYKKLGGDAMTKEKSNTLLRKLLDLQSDIALQVKTITNSRERLEVIDSLKNNLLDILSFEFVCSNILDEDQDRNWSYFGYIVRTLKSLNETDEGKIAVASIIKSVLYSLDYLNEEENKQKETDFLFSVFISLFAWSIREMDFSIMDDMLGYYSCRSYVLEGEYNSAVLFSILSLYLYDLCELETVVPSELSARIKDKLVEQERKVVGNSAIFSWNHLFKQFASNSNIDYSRFMRVYNNNRDSMDYMLINDDAKFVVLNEYLGFKWFMTMFVNKEDNLEYDFNNMFNEKCDKLDYYLDEFYKDCYDDDVFSPPEYMFKMLSFYGLDLNKESLFIIIERQNHTLFNFIMTNRKERITTENAVLEKANDLELGREIKRGVESALEKEWGLDKTLKVSSEEKWVNFLLFRRKYDTAEILIDYFVRSIVFNTKKGLEFKELIINSSLDEKVSDVLKDQIIAITNNCKSSLPFLIKDEAIKNELLEKVKSYEIIKESSIIPSLAFVKKDGFSFNIEIDDVQVVPPQEDVIDKYVDRFKRADGQYVLEGAFMSRDDVYETVKKRLRLISLSLKDIIKTKQYGIIECRYHPRRKKTSEENSLSSD